MKKLIVVICFLFSICFIIPIFETPEPQALSVSGNWSSYKEQITKGSGTNEDPFLIESAGQLAYLSDFLKQGNNNAASFKLTQSINMSSHYFSTIHETFRGMFDGGQHAIIGLTTIEDVGAGLFDGGERCEVNNLVFEDVNIVSNGVGHTGTLFSYIQNSKVSNVCVMSGTINAKADCAWAGLGGVIGWSDNSEVTFCYNNSNIICSSSDIYGYYIGGVIGCQVREGKYENLINYGDIVVSGLARDVNTGGILGTSTVADIVNCLSIANINTNLSSYNSGAIIGYNSKNIKNCYYISNVGVDGNNGGSEQTFTNITTLPESWDKEFWAIDDKINNGRPYLKWLYWQHFVG